MQCPQCRQPNDHNARFCVQCGARVRASACASCGGALPATALFCPACGSAVVGAAPPPAASRIERDPAEALLTARDADGIEDEPPALADVELFERVRRARARTRTIHRSLLLAGVALIALVAALVLAQRTPRPAMQAAGPSADVPAPPPAVSAPQRTPTPSSERAVKPRATAREAAQAPSSPGQDSRNEPAAMPRAAAPRPDIRVEVAQTPTGGAVDYTVRVSRPDGAPVSDADVRLRGVMADGALVEARLEPAAEPGVYHSLVAFSPRGPRGLTVRVARADGVVEVPVRDP